MKCSVRYYGETDTYYIQIRGAEYTSLTNKINHINTRLRHFQAPERASERLLLQKKRKEYQVKRQRAERYVEIPPEDIPEGANVRPIFSLTGEIVEAEPQWYRNTLNKLRENAAARQLAEIEID